MPRDDTRDSSEKDRYYDLFLDSDAVNWRELEAKDPTSRDDLQFLDAVDRIRQAYRSGSADSTETVNFLLQHRARSPSSPDRRDGERRGDFPDVSGYEIIEEIGRGGFATIFRARSLSSGEEVALKILKSRKDLSAAALARFLREARALASLKHENILRIHHVIDEAEVLGLSMELIHGKTLARILADEGPFAPRALAQIGVAICRALAAVHRAGYVHRDIKAENIMRDSTGRIVLMDFGLTRSLNPESRVTDTGVLVGTPLVMAPEQYAFKDVDARTDIYALGCVFYRLVTGEHPVSGRSMEQLRRKVLAGQIADVRELRPGIPEGLSLIINRCMAVKPSRRYRSAQELEEALAGWIETGSPGPAEGLIWRSFVVRALMLLAGLAALIGVALLIRALLGEGG